MVQIKLSKLTPVKQKRKHFKGTLYRGEKLRHAKPVLSTTFCSWGELDIHVHAIKVSSFEVYLAENWQVYCLWQSRCSLLVTFYHIQDSPCIDAIAGDKLNKRGLYWSDSNPRAWGLGPKKGKPFSYKANRLILITFLYFSVRKWS